MGAFTTNPPLEDTGFVCLASGRKRYRLTEDLVYVIGYKDSPFTVTVPKGFETDLATSPRWMWWYIKPEGEYNNSTILHDFLYSIQVDRAMADGLLRESLKVLNVAKLKRNLMFYAVRCFGWYYYYGIGNRDRKYLKQRTKDLVARWPFRRKSS